VLERLAEEQQGDVSRARHGVGRRSGRWGRSVPRPA
jgi:hypothetical protein